MRAVYGASVSAAMGSSHNSCPELFAPARRCPRIVIELGVADMRSIALWLLGIPIPIIILLWFFVR